MKTTFKTMLFLVAVIFTFSACSSDDDTNTGEVQVQVTDAPFPFHFMKEAKIEVTKIELKNTQGEYVTVFEGNTSIDFVKYRNGETEDLAVENIPAGTYVAARITVGGAELKLTNEETFTIQATNGMVERPITPELMLEENQNQEILVDLDLSDSFVFSGSFIGDWITNITQITGIQSFNPDIRVACLNKTGAISGVVKDINNQVVESAEVYIMYDYNGDGIKEKISTVTEADGSFKILGIPEGNYTLYVNSENGEFTANVEVSMNNTFTLECTVGN